MKKLIALALAMLMLLPCFAAMAEGFDKHVTFTINTTHSNSSMDYNNDNLYKYVSEKFNFDYEVWPVSKDAQSEKLRAWINGGTMPDSVTWRNFDYQEYVTYAEQGLLGALPEGWEQAYPNLFEMVDNTGLYEKMKVDGETYGIPHATFARYAGMDTYVNHLSIYYRKDWVEQLGLPAFGASITLSQLAEYIQLSIEKDLAGNGNTLGLSVDPGYNMNFFMLFCDVDWDAFMKTEEGYVLCAKDPRVVEAIKLSRDWYERGLTSPDFYLNAQADAINAFTSGIAAAMFHNCAITSYAGYKTTFDESTGLDSDDCIGIAAIADDEGVVRAIETGNYWSATFFAPESSQEVLNRVLAIMDWACSVDGQMAIMMGVPGETWEYDANGEIVMLTEMNEKGAYPATADLYNSYSVFRALGILADDFGFINPSNDPSIIQQVLDMYAVKQTGSIIMLDYDYEFFASDNKANFSMDFEDEITRLVIAKDIDVAAEWAAFIDKNESMWQPVIDDLNKAFIK